MDDFLALSQPGKGLVREYLSSGFAATTSQVGRDIESHSLDNGFEEGFECHGIWVEAHGSRHVCFANAVMTYHRAWRCNCHYGDRYDLWECTRHIKEL